MGTFCPKTFQNVPKRSWQKETFQTFLSFLSFLDAAKKPPPAKTGEGCLASSGRFELPAPRLGGECSIQLSYEDKALPAV